jgi:hypothetical protein
MRRQTVRLEATLAQANGRRSRIRQDGQPRAPLTVWLSAAPTRSTKSPCRHSGRGRRNARTPTRDTGRPHRTLDNRPWISHSGHWTVTPDTGRVDAWTRPSMRTVDQGTAGIRTDILDHHDHPTARWAADVLGVSGRAMLAALVRGERDPHMLAELAKGRLRTKLPQLRQALRGRFRDHHALLVRLALGHLEHLEGTIATLDRRVDEVMAPFARARDQLDTITGVGKRAAETIIAEIGVDMSVFPTAGHLAHGRAAARATTAPAANAARASPPKATAG